MPNLEILQAPVENVLNALQELKQSIVEAGYPEEIASQIDLISTTVQELIDGISEGKSQSPSKPGPVGPVPTEGGIGGQPRL